MANAPQILSPQDYHNSRAKSMDYNKAIRELDTKISRQRETLEASIELRKALLALEEEENKRRSTLKK